MKTINVDLSSGDALNLLVGRQGESGVTQVVFDFSALKTEFGTGTVSLSVKRPKEYTPYAQTITTSGTNATWLVNETDTGVAGCGEIQLTYTVNSQIAKTVVYKYTVYPSIGVDGEYPIPGQTWQEEIEEDIAEIKEDLSSYNTRITALEQGGSGSGLTEDIKTALLQLAAKVAYIDDDGQDYYDDLEDALYPPAPPAELSYITCVYTQSGTVYDTDNLNSLKSDLVVTAHYTNGTTGTVTNYTLSGTLTAGTSTITVSYSGKTTTFNVTVTAAPLVPSDYTQVGYIQLPSGLTNIVVNTEVVLTGTGDAVIEVDMMPEDTDTNNHYAIGAAQTGSATSIGCAVGTTTGVNLTSFNGIVASVQPNDGDSLTGMRINAVGTFNSTSASITDGTLTDTQTGTGREYKTYPISLFGVKKGTVSQTLYPFHGRIYRAKITENNVLVMDAIPCTRNSDDAAGFYDRINDKFITNASLVAGGSA